MPHRSIFFPKILLVTLRLLFFSSKGTDKKWSRCFFSTPAKKEGGLNCLFGEQAYSNLKLSEKYILRPTMDVFD